MTLLNILLILQSKLQSQACSVSLKKMRVFQPYSSSIICSKRLWNWGLLHNEFIVISQIQTVYIFINLPASKKFNG